MRVLLIDNFDSFTYNLVHYLENNEAEVIVIRNNELDKIQQLDFEKIVISPGPGLPSESGQLNQIISQWYNKVPILGVCLGMQALGVFFGGELYNLQTVSHGVTKTCKKTASGVLTETLPHRFEVGLYHSWALKSVPEKWVSTLESTDGILMAMEHKELPLFAVQFHPESILTTSGNLIIKHFVDF